MLRVLSFTITGKLLSRIEGEWTTVGYNIEDIHLVMDLKGHSQLMHMRIRYHFLADLHVTRHERGTESEKRIRNTQNKPC